MDNAAVANFYTDVESEQPLKPMFSRPLKTVHRPSTLQCIADVCANPTTRVFEGKLDFTNEMEYQPGSKYAGTWEPCLAAMRARDGHGDAAIALFSCPSPPTLLFMLTIALLRDTASLPRQRCRHCLHRQHIFEHVEMEKQSNGCNDAARCQANNKLRVVGVWMDVVAVYWYAILLKAVLGNMARIHFIT